MQPLALKVLEIAQSNKAIGCGLLRRSSLVRAWYKAIFELYIEVIKAAQGESQSVLYPSGSSPFNRDTMVEVAAFAPAVPIEPDSSK